MVDTLKTTLTRLLWYEAGHEGKDGIELVGSTILNRIKLNRSYLGGQTVQGVIEHKTKGAYVYRAMSKKDTPLPAGKEATK